MSMAPAPTDGRRYSRLGKYEVLVHLASGGMGAVYKAMDVELGREVALKILSPELANKPALLERFQREARHIAQLRHPNIVKIYEFGEAHGTYFLALELVDGVDLHEHIGRKGQLDLDESLLLLTQAAQALDHLHQQRMLAKKPAERYQTPALLLSDLARAGSPHGARSAERGAQSAEGFVLRAPRSALRPGLSRETPHEVKRTAADTCQLPSVSPEQR